MALHKTMLLACLLTVVTLADARILDTQQFKDVMYDELRELLNLNSQLSREQQQEAAVVEAIDVPPRPQEVPNWGHHLAGVGQVSGVSVNPRGEPVIFHRSDRVWDASTFNDSDDYQHQELGPISSDTILTLDPTTGKILHRWGKDLFYMPHGIHIDQENNLWLTDVALHQVFKFPPGYDSPEMVFGVRFVPGHSRSHLCKPSAVAVATSGEVFIADGYCNSRILKFDHDGTLQRIIPQPPEFLALRVPHSLALVENLNLICIADRENMRVTCPTAGLAASERRGWHALPPATIQEPDLGRVFAIAARGNFIYAVNGPTSKMIPVRGFTLDPKEETIIDHWSPDAGFRNPHDIAISPDASAMYVTEIGPNRVWKFQLKKKH